MVLVTKRFERRPINSVSKKKSRHGFLTFFPKWLVNFSQFLCTYYMFLYMLDYVFVFSYFQL